MTIMFTINENRANRRGQDDIIIFIRHLSYSVAYLLTILSIQIFNPSLYEAVLT